MLKLESVASGSSRALAVLRKLRSSLFSTASSSKHARATDLQLVEADLRCHFHAAAQPQEVHAQVVVGRAVVLDERRQQRDLLAHECSALIGISGPLLWPSRG